MAEATKFLKIEGARENNLKDIALEIPHDALTAVTGLSGSGKSSLAFDTVYAEGQRRYIETFSPYTRQFFDKVKKPDLDAIAGVRPAVAIQQRTRVTSSRSTVGSLTDINDYLKVLWSNISKPMCVTCGKEISRYRAREVADILGAWSQERPDATFFVCAPLYPQSAELTAAHSKVKKSPGKGRSKRRSLSAQEAPPPLAGGNLRDEIIARGFTRVFSPLTLEVEQLAESPHMPLLPDGSALIVLDRLRPGTSASPDLLKRLSDSVEQAYALSGQLQAGSKGKRERCVIIEMGESARASGGYSTHNFSPYYECPCQPLPIPAPKPSLFSFNHPIGACPECKGFGNILAVDRALCVPDPSLSLEEKALHCWAGPSAKAEMKELLAFCRAEGIRTDIPWAELSPSDQDKIFVTKNKDFWGVLPWFKWIERKTYKMHVRVFLSKYRTQIACPACNGSRLKAAALAYRVNGRTLPELWEMPVSDILPFLQEIERGFSEAQRTSRALKELLAAMRARLEFLCNLGLPYLTLNRTARTLSGGETQRVNLATALGSELVSTQFVLDEPSVGLHARDSSRLIDAVRALTDRGNSVLVVEHDPECILAADHIIELGPLPGAAGGHIVFSGPTESWSGLSAAPPPTPSPYSVAPNRPQLVVKNASKRNLKSLSTAIPLHAFVCLTGVSGSGKSSLVDEVLMPAYTEWVATQKLHAKGTEPASTNATIAALCSGFEHLHDVLLIDQSPLAKSPRANIATYTGMWDSVRDLLAQTETSRALGLSKSSFSFNVDAGRCPACSGVGFIREDMQFLSDVFVPCEVCLGKRFQHTVLQVQYRGLEVSQILKLSVEEAREFFKDESAIQLAAEVLVELGLGHLTLGHPLSELSGGEAQRLKLVPVIEASRRKNRTQDKGSLLIFDEPTTGLHQRDVERLVSVFFNLRRHGHSILCIEHNLALIACADWIIDLGPEGGEAGGELIAAGPPATFLDPALAGRSHTARFLQRYFSDFSRQQRQRPPSVGKNKPSKGSRALASSDRVFPAQTLQIRGAREHNLKDVSLDVPLRKFVALTGVSGSGKSTLAKDIIYAEGQRRYLDCLSPYARQFIKELRKPDIDDIKNIVPTVCVYQHTFQPSRISTVGTMSEVYNFLRLLYAKIGVQHCPDHPSERITPLSPEDIAREISRLSAPSVRVLAPIVKHKKGTHRAILERVVSSEVTQVRIDGVFLSPSSLAGSGGLEKNKAHTIEFVLGKFNPSQVEHGILKELVAQALSLGSGTLIVLKDKEEVIFSTERTCPICKQGFFKPDPEDLSFSSRRGRCPRCEGTGLVTLSKRTTQEGICPECNGARIGALGRNLRLAGMNIHEASTLTPRALSEFLSSLNLSETAQHIATPIVREMSEKISTLSALGLGYLSLARDCHSLSSGELQRLRLAAAMGSPLSGAMYIFDEPSAGLHPLDNRLVLARLRSLLERDNSILMIEHDAESIRAAEEIIDVGPGGGREGGNIVYQGPTKEFLASSESTTARCLRGEANTLSSSDLSPFQGNLEVAERLLTEYQPAPGTLTISSASLHNILNLNVSLPLHALVVVAGVSGAGKSSFLRGIVYQGLTGSGRSHTTWESERGRIESSLPIERVLEVDQRPIGINSRSTPASYLKIFDDMRTLLARTPEAIARGWGPGFFSYNSGKGRCPECKGLGVLRLEMSFLPDAQVQCESCLGQRYSDEALNVQYLGLSVADMLALTFDEAKLVFANHRRIHRKLHLACELGLGYLTLGQSSASLSGGESQRIKLVAELATPRKGHTIYLLDEPTTGLHKLDVARLIRTLRELVRLGNSVYVIEHEEDVLMQADQVIEFGPGPGEQGGRIVFQGPPAKLRAASTNWGEVLRLTSGTATNSFLASRRESDQASH
jgi:excinuclease ABC subunit A